MIDPHEESLPTPTNLQASNKQKLFQAPPCTICLGLLTQDISSLDCGHVFHLACISQQFEYRRSCPNCQKKASQKQLRMVHFQLTPHTNVEDKMAVVMEEMKSADSAQLDFLLNKIRDLSRSNEQLTEKASSHQKSCKAQSRTIQELRRQVHDLKSQEERLYKQNKKLNGDLKIKMEELLASQRQQHLIEVDLKRLEEKETYFEQMRLYSKILSEGSQQIVNYRQLLQSQGTSDQQMSRTFYDMLLMKNLELLKTKDRLKDHSNKIIEKEGEITRLKISIEHLKKDIKDLREKKCEEVKKEAEMQVEPVNKISIEDPQKMKMNFTTLKKSAKMLPQTPNLPSTVKKALLPQGNTTFGGFFFKKKDTKFIY